MTALTQMVPHGSGTDKFFFLDLLPISEISYNPKEPSQLPTMWHNTTSSLVGQTFWERNLHSTHWFPGVKNADANAYRQRHDCHLVFELGHYYRPKPALHPLSILPSAPPFFPDIGTGQRRGRSATPPRSDRVPLPHSDADPSPRCVHACCTGLVIHTPLIRVLLADFLTYYYPLRH